MKKFIINDLSTFQTFLRTIVKFVPSARFIVSDKFTRVSSINESQATKGFFATNTMVLETDSDETVSFTLKDISKLFKCLQLIESTLDEEEPKISIGYDKGNLIYDNDAAFKFKTIKEELIKELIGGPNKMEYETEYSFITTVPKIKQVIQANAIIANDDTRIYISKKNDKVLCEVEDKRNQYSDSIGLPISENILEGDVTTVTCMKYKDFLDFSLLPAEEILIKFTKQNVYEVNSKYINNSSVITMRLFTQIIKG